MLSLLDRCLNSFVQNLFAKRIKPIAKFCSFFFFHSVIQGMMNSVRPGIRSGTPVSQKSKGCKGITNKRSEHNCPEDALSPPTCSLLYIKVLKQLQLYCCPSMIQKAEHMPSLPWSTLQGKHALSRLNQGEEMRMSLWISNYNYPEKDQKTFSVLLQAMGKMATTVKLL